MSTEAGLLQEEYWLHSVPSGWSLEPAVLHGAWLLSS